MVSLILQLIVGCFTVVLMFEHHKPLWGSALLIAMLVVVVMKLSEWLGKGK